MSTPGILQDIQTAITRSALKSLLKLIAQTGISLVSAHTAVRNMLKFYPYRMQVFNELIHGETLNELTTASVLKT